jgi:ankyrin repeat protein
MAGASIHEACRSGDVDVVRAMIAADPSVVDADDEHGWRPVFHAGLYRQEGVVRLLLDAGADLAAHDGSALHYAGEAPGNKAIVSLLVLHGALDAHVRPADDLSRQFLAAVFLADATRARSLLGRLPHLATAADGRGDQPIHHAARNGDTEIVRLLIEFGARVSARSTRGHSVLYCAGGHGHLGALRLLLAEGGSDPTLA